MECEQPRRERLSSSKFHACSSFTQIDPAYVRLQQSEADIAAALRIRGEHALILLHGGAGTGKTWLARQIAAQCHARIPVESLRSESFDEVETAGLGTGSSFESSYENVFLLECGVEADAESKLLELLFILSAEKGITHDQYYDEDHHHEIWTRLQFLLRERETLIILDDVWDPEFLKTFLEAFLGIRATLFVISRKSNLCDNFSHRAVKIQDITSADAKKILAGHAGLRHYGLPPHLQEVAEQLVMISENNPLALAIMGKRIAGAGHTNVFNWNAVVQSYFDASTDDAHEESETDARCASIVRKSMRLACKDLDLSSELLLTLTAMCKDLSTPEQVVRMMRQCLSGYDVGVYPTDIIRPTLWQVNNHCADWRNLIEFSIKTFSLHHLQKRFILENMTKVVELMISFLNKAIIRADVFTNLNESSDNVTDDTLVAVLTAFYLQKHFAQEATTLHGFPVEKLQSSKFLRIALEPLVVIMDDEVFGKRLALCAKQLYVRCVINGDLDDKSLAELLCSETFECGFATCAALGNISLVQKRIRLQFVGSVRHTVRSLLAKLRHVHEAHAREALMIHALSILAQYEANQKYIMESPEYLHLVVKKSIRTLDLVVSKSTRSLQVQRGVASILANVSAHSEEDCQKIGRSSGAIPHLIELLFLRPHDDVELQERVLCTLANLAVDEENQNMMIEFPRIYGQLIKTYKLSHLQGTTDTLLSFTCLQLRSHVTRMLANLSSLNDEIRQRIGEVPDAISMFRRMLFYEDVDVQEKVICLLANLSLNRANQKMIINVTEPYREVFYQQLMDKYFSFESSSQLREGIATMLANLTYDDDHIRRKIGRAPGAIEKLLKHSCELEHQAPQEQILCTLASLALMEENRVKMLQYTPLLEQLVRSLAFCDSSVERQKSSTGQVQKELARFLVHLSFHSDDVRLWIGRIPKVIPWLLRDLEHGEPDLQQEIVYALARLSLSDDLREEILLQSPLIFVDVVREISSPSLSVQRRKGFAILLANLTRYNEDTGIAVGVDAKVIRDLMAVSHGVDAELQEAVVCALANLSTNSVNRANIMAHRRFLDELAMEESKSLQIRKDVARLLASLSSDNNEVRFRLGDNEQALETLIQINYHRSEYKRRQLQLSALANLALNEATQRKILRLPGFLERLRQLCFKDESHKLEQNVVRLLINLSSHGQKDIEAIATVPKVLSRLTASLFEFNDAKLQSLVLRALTNLASNEANREMITEIPKFLERTLKLAEKGHEKEVVTLLAHLSRPSSRSVVNPYLLGVGERALSFE